MHFVVPGFRTLTIPYVRSHPASRGTIIKALQESSDD